MKEGHNGVTCFSTIHPSWVGKLAFSGAQLANWCILKFSTFSLRFPKLVVWTLQCCVEPKFASTSLTLLRTSCSLTQFTAELYIVHVRWTNYLKAARCTVGEHEWGDLDANLTRPTHSRRGNCVRFACSQTAAEMSPRTGRPYPAIRELRLSNSSACTSAQDGVYLVTVVLRL